MFLVTANFRANQGVVVGTQPYATTGMNQGVVGGTQPYTTTGLNQGAGGQYPYAPEPATHW